MSKKYNIIYADPAWTYRDTQSAGERGASYKYPLLNLDAIKALGIKDLAAENSALFLWATGPLLRDAQEVIDAWGFAYRTVAFTWEKLNPKDGQPFMGMGNYTRANAEFCLLATRGRLERQSKSVRSLVRAPRGRHSEKPAEVRDRIVELFGDLPRVELFAREKPPGWDVWGNEVDSDIELPRRESVLEK
jgi:N6-adenosine-specific RNA methylase IME4